MVVVLGVLADLIRPDVREHRAVERDRARTAEPEQLVVLDVPTRPHADVDGVPTRAELVLRLNDDVSREIRDARVEQRDAVRVGEVIVIEVEAFRHRDHSSH